MNDNNIFTTTLTYCEKKFYAHFYRKGDVYRFFFVDEQFKFYDFNVKRNSELYHFLNKCKNGKKLNVTWKTNKNTLEKNILCVSDVIA